MLNDSQSKEEQPPRQRFKGSSFKKFKSLSVSHPSQTKPSEQSVSPFEIQKLCPVVEDKIMPCPMPNGLSEDYRIIHLINPTLPLFQLSPNGELIPVPTYTVPQSLIKENKPGLRRQPSKSISLTADDSSNEIYLTKKTKRNKIIINEEDTKPKPKFVVKKEDDLKKERKISELSEGEEINIGNYQNYTCEHTDCECVYKTKRQLKSHHFKKSRECHKDSMKILSMIAKAKRIINRINPKKASDENWKNSLSEIESTFNAKMNGCNFLISDYFRLLCGTKLVEEEQFLSSFKS